MGESNNAFSNGIYKYKKSKGCVLWTFKICFLEGIRIGEVVKYKYYNNELEIST